MRRELVAYDVSDDAWAQIDLPDDTAPLGRNSIVATDDAIVLYRTTDAAGAAPDWVFDPAEQSWSELPDDPLGPAFGRSSSDIENQAFVTRRAASVGDAIVVVGGDKFGPDGSALLADAYMWTP